MERKMLNEVDGKTFARTQARLLQDELSCDQAFAWEVIRAGSPGAVKPALEWLKEVISHMDDFFSRERKLEALSVVLCGGIDGKIHEHYVRDVLDIVDVRLGYDAYGVLTHGTRGRTFFGRERQIAAMKELRLPIPEHYNAHSLFAALEAAKKIVSAGYLP